MRLLLWILWLGGAPTAWACSCDSERIRRLEQDSVPRASLAFYGKFLSSQIVGGNRLLKFKILKTWKGTEGGDVILSTSQNKCGLPPLLENAQVLILSMGPSGSTYTVCDTLIFNQGDAERRMKKMPAPKK